MQKTGNRISSKVKDIKTAIIFLMPSLVVFSVFVFFPLVFSFYLSFHKWNLISPTKIFIGFKNYFDVFFSDPLFYKVLWNTTVFSVVVVFVTLTLGLILAIILNKDISGKSIYRAAIFMPYITSVSAMALLWLWIFDPTYGLINSTLTFLNITGPKWLSSIEWSLPALIIMTIWRFTGYSMLLYLGGLQNLPEEVREAAIVDGASDWKLFWYITFPLLSPTTFFIAITSIITMFKNFETVPFLILLKEP